jgi:type III secretory pathway component EscT
VQGVSFLLSALRDLGVDLMGLALAWARLLPTLVLVPAFGAKVLPRAAVTVLGLGLGLVLAPALAASLHGGVPVGAAPGAVPIGAVFVLQLVLQVLAGLPLALSSAALLWAAMMAGGLIDDLRGAQGGAPQVFNETSTPLATLFGLFVAFAFLQLGGASHVLEGLVPEPTHGLGFGAQILLPVVANLVSAIGVALALATPILVAVIVWEIAAALIARAATPAHVQSVVAPLRSLVLLGVLALSLEGIFALLQQAVVG